MPFGKAFRSILTVPFDQRSAEETVTGIALLVCFFFVNFHSWNQTQSGLPERKTKLTSRRRYCNIHIRTIIIIIWINKFKLNLIFKKKRKENTGFSFSIASMVLRMNPSVTFARIEFHVLVLIIMNIKFKFNWIYNYQYLK